MCIENEPPKRNSLTIKGFVKLSYLKSKGIRGGQGGQRAWKFRGPEWPEGQREPGSQGAKGQVACKI